MEKGSTALALSLTASGIALSFVFGPEARGVKAELAMISTISLRMLKSCFAKDSRSSVELLRPERTDRLLDQVMEELLDEGRVGLLAAGQEGRQSPGARERHGSPDRVW